MKKNFLIAFILLLTSGFFLNGQTPVEVPLSATVQMVGDQIYFFHPVRPGQTLYSISRAYGVTQELILSANPDLAHGLRADQIIRIPASVHVAEPRETIFGISRQYGLETSQLRALNPALYEKDLQIGQRLYIPGLKAEQDLASKQQATRDSGPVPKPDDKREPPAEGYLFIPEIRKEKIQEAFTGCPEAMHKDKYHVALLIPLFLEEMEATLNTAMEEMAFRPGQMPDQSLLPQNHTSFSFIPYYQGVIVALDSIRSRGMDVTLHVFDVGLDVSQAYRLTRENQLKGMDLIIGPFYRAPMEHIAAFALQNDIPVVSPLHADKSQLYRFPNLFKVTPSMDLMLNNLARYIATQYPDEHIILVHNDQPQTRELISGFRQNLQSDIHFVSDYTDSINLAKINGYFLEDALIGTRVTNLMVMSDPLPGRNGRAGVDQNAVRVPHVSPNVTQVIYDKEGISGLFKKMDRNKTNILVTMVGGEAFLSNYLRELSLNTDAFDMLVMGIPDWERYQNVEIDYLQNLQVHIFTPDFYDYDDPHIRNFIRAYRTAYKSEPTADALKAGQTTWFFLDAMSRFGTSWPECIHLLNLQGIHSPFNFGKTLGNEHGWENRYSSIYVYRDFRLLDVRKRDLQKKTASEGR
jgi:LysM repeat protein